MNTGVIIGLMAIVGLLIYFWWFETSVSKNAEFKLLDGSQPGSLQRTIPTPLPRSFNQPEGLTFSYACWILIKDFGSGYGKKRRIFERGENSPALYIDSTSNSLLVNLKTFGEMETLVIPNIPAMKWIHFALVVDQNAVDIYINGTLREHRSTVQLPKQTNDSIVLGPGWDGVVARLSYWARSLSPKEVQDLSRADVPDDLMGRPGAPQYFDITWYIGRLSSA